MVQLMLDFELAGGSLPTDTRIQEFIANVCIFSFVIFYDHVLLVCFFTFFLFSHEVLIVGWGKLFMCEHLDYNS